MTEKWLAFESVGKLCSQPITFFPFKMADLHLYSKDQNAFVDFVKFQARIIILDVVLLFRFLSLFTIHLSVNNIENIFVQKVFSLYQETNNLFSFKSYQLHAKWMRYSQEPLTLTINCYMTLILRHKQLLWEIKCRLLSYFKPWSFEQKHSLCNVILLQCNFPILHFVLHFPHLVITDPKYDFWFLLSWFRCIFDSWDEKKNLKHLFWQT